MARYWLLLAAAVVGAMVAGVVVGHHLRDDRPEAGGFGHRLFSGLLGGLCLGGLVTAGVMGIGLGMGELVELAL